MADYEEFCRNLKYEVEVLTPKRREARAILMNLKQVGSVSDFVNVIESVPNQILICEEEIVEHFVFGLKDEISSIVKFFDPPTFEKAIEIAKIQEKGLELVNSSKLELEYEESKEFSDADEETASEEVSESAVNAESEQEPHNVSDETVDIHPAGLITSKDYLHENEENASEDKGHDGDLKVEEATRSLQGLGTSNGTAETQDPLSFSLNFNDTFDYGDFSFKEDGAIVLYLPYSSLYHYALISAKVLVMESLKYEMQPDGFLLCCIQQHISMLLDFEMVNENQLSQIKLAFKMRMDCFKEEFGEPNQMVAVRYIYDPGIPRKTISNPINLTLELILLNLRKHVYFARGKLRLEFLAQYRDKEGEELNDEQPMLEKLIKPLVRKALSTNEEVAFKVQIHHVEKHQIMSSMEFGKCFINLDVRELDWRHDYFSNFHAIIALSGGTAGRTKVLHLEGIGLKHGSFFTIEETPGKNDDVPECLRTGTKPSLGNAPNSIFLQNAHYEEAGDVQFNLVTFKGSQEVNKIFMRIMIIIWSWYYKDIAVSMGIMIGNSITELFQRSLASGKMELEMEKLHG